MVRRFLTISYQLKDSCVTKLNKRFEKLHRETIDVTSNAQNVTYQHKS